MIAKKLSIVKATKVISPAELLAEFVLEYKNMEKEGMKIREKKIDLY